MKKSWLLVMVLFFVAIGCGPKAPETISSAPIKGKIGGQDWEAKSYKWADVVNSKWLYIYNTPTAPGPFDTSKNALMIVTWPGKAGDFSEIKHLGENNFKEDVFTTLKTAEGTNVLISAKGNRKIIIEKQGEEWVLKIWLYTDKENTVEGTLKIQE